MLFNSLSFVIFLPLVFTAYWLLSGRKLKWQNLLLLIASYYFYASWDWRFLGLLVFSTALDYFTGSKIFTATNKKNKTKWLWLSIIINLGILGVFKYYNFFAVALVDSLSYLGWQVNFWVLQVILPLGISFYTFHGLSYVIDIYKGRIKPCSSFLNYSVFVSFFPLLIAGPIERAQHLLPQIEKPRNFNYHQAIDGLRQILWGLFKKMAIADLIAYNVDIIFNNYTDYSGSTLVIGAVLFSIQIYCDFSGYSDIALGTARLFGIDLLKNFSFPYFSRDIAEFWRRWHISLTSWFRDYLYIPLGGSRRGLLITIRNTFIIFLVRGFWHGANWTFIAWGLLNAIYFLPVLLRGKNRRNLEIVAAGKLLPSVKDIFSILLTFSLTTFAWIFFRSPSLHVAWGYITRIITSDFVIEPTSKLIAPLLFSFFFLLIEWLGRENEYALAKLGLNWPSWLRWAAYLIIAILILSSNSANHNFIYFQF
jgi:D-alanyl-lipoteichoic acid acyltransferase DltB (MBOAT superfamily)